MKKIKVLFLIHNNCVDGSLLSFMDLAEALLKNNIEINAVGKKDLLQFPIFKQFLQNTGIKFYPVPIVLSYTEKWRVRNFLPYLKFILSLLPKKIYSFFYILKIAKSLSPDLIHSNTGVLQEGFFVSKLLSIPHVWHLREYQDLDFGFQIYPSKKIFQLLLSHSYCIPITKDIKNHFGLQEVLSKVVYDGVDSEKKIVAFGGEQKLKVFLCASRLQPEKGQEEVVRAFSKFVKRHPDYRLVVAGNGDSEYKKKLIRVTKEILGTDSRKIEFIGFQSPENIRLLMRKSRALIVPSKREGFGRMTAEAMLNSCLVIGKRTGGTEEILNLCGGFGYLGGVEALAEKMEEVCQLSKRNYEEQSKKSYHSALRFFTNEASGKQVLDFYHQILTDRLKTSIL